ncbi:MAG: cytochrome c-type biogenesis protein CcmH [Ardenticatenaceae bacterium]|nr:cytochrome c-type biogenesis protein CcmH [Ardenticatenaceae bacterium]
MTRNISYAWRFTLYALLLLIFVTPAFAQEGISDNEVNDVAEGLYCPVCESTPLDVCATQACADWRELIRTKLAQGETPQDIYDYFALQYGDGVLAEPPREGANLILWLFPIVAIVLGGLYFGRTMRGLKMAAEEEVTAVTPSAPAPQNNAKPVAEKRPLEEYISQIEQEIAQ